MKIFLQNYQSIVINRFSTVKQLKIKKFFRIVIKHWFDYFFISRHPVHANACSIHVKILFYHINNITKIRQLRSLIDTYTPEKT